MHEGEGRANEDDGMEQKNACWCKAGMTRSVHIAGPSGVALDR